MKSKINMRSSKKLSIQTQTFFMQKLGNKLNEYEDSLHYSRKKGKFAIADGVSESCFAKLWANLLTKYFVRSNSSLFSLKNFSDNVKEEVLQPLLSSAQKEWNNKIDWKNLAWYVEDKTKRGAFATFLGLEVKRDEKQEDLYCWRAVAVGDCCLFQIDNKQLTSSFPLNDSTQFENTPSMLSSRFSPNDIFDKCKIHVEEGTIKANGQIILATDALAKWILEENESGRQVWKEAILLKDKRVRSIFEKLVKTKKIRNDDITLVILTF